MGDTFWLFFWLALALCYIYYPDNDRRDKW